MGKRNIVGWATVAIIVLVVGVLGRQIAVERNSKQVMREYLEAKILRLEEQNKELLAKLPEAQDESMEVVASIAPAAEVPAKEQPPAETEEPETDGRRMMRSISKMLDNLAMNKMMAASQRGALDVMYADLADKFQLDGEEREHFMELLLARQMGLVDASMKMMAGNLTKEEQDALSADMEEKNNLMKEEMEYFLNSADDVAEWEFYEKTMGDRMMLSQVEQSLGDSDEALSDQTYRQLLEAIDEERSGYDFSADLADNQNMDMSPERFSPEKIEGYSNDLKALNEIIKTRAQAILTPEQLVAFIKCLDANTEMQLAQLEMAAQMFGK